MLHRGGSVLSIANYDGWLEIWRIAIEIRTGEKYLRADTFAGRNFLAQLLQKNGAAAHVAHGGDAIGDEQRKNEFAAADGFARTGKVHVHVGESWNEEFAGGVDDFCAERDVKRRGRADGCDARISDNDGGIGLQEARR